MDKVLNYLNENPWPKIQFETFSKSDTLEEAIQKIVSVWDIDTVGMVTQGATGAKEIFMGSNTVKILKKVKNCPVLVVPSGHNFQNLKILVFPTGFRRNYEKFELLTITELAEQWQRKYRFCIWP